MSIGIGSFDCSQIEWSLDPQPLREICKELETPFLVKIDDKDMTTSFGDEVDVNRPFLVYDRREKTKVFAENLIWNPESNKNEPSGTYLEIPTDYPGWFDVIIPNEPAPKHHSTIESLANTGCKAFLSCSTVIGYRCKEGEHELEMKKEVSIYQGEVLMVIEEITKAMKPSLLFEESATDQSIPTYLKCMDSQRRGLYLPFSLAGKFCVIAENKDHENAVHPLAGLLRQQLPLLARVVFGRPPPNLPDFRGFMRLFGYKRPSTIIAHNMLPADDKFLVLEVPEKVSSGVRRATNMDAIKEMPQWSALVQQCSERIPPYVTLMKCKYKTDQITVPIDMLTVNLFKVFSKLAESEQNGTGDTSGIQLTDPDDISIVSEEEVSC